MSTRDITQTEALFTLPLKLKPTHNIMWFMESVLGVFIQLQCSHGIPTEGSAFRDMGPGYESNGEARPRLRGR